jgi:hypothetical protein
VASAAAAGWVWAGPPADGTAIVPPSCPVRVPAAFGTPVVGDAGTAVADRLVPVGPVSVRVCGYASGGAAVVTQRVLDPTRTAALAGTLDTPPPGAAVDGAGGPDRAQQQRARCAGASPAVLVFRYKQAPTLLVTVAGGGCRLVSTSARGETGRDDVVREVARILAGG